MWLTLLFNQLRLFSGFVYVTNSNSGPFLVLVLNGTSSILSKYLTY